MIQMANTVHLKHRNTESFYAKMTVDELKSIGRFTLSIILVHHCHPAQFSIVWL